MFIQRHVASRVWLTGLLLVGSGCSGPAASDTVVASAVPTGALAGYQHVAARSLFKPGGSPASVSELGFTKVVGTNGVFATDETNGWVIASPNGGAPSTQRPPFAGTGDQHNARVLKYFLQSGIPADQVAGVDVHTMMRGASSTAGARVAPTLVGYYSVLHRAINGIPVGESFAWARFNADDEVVEESVYWPELPASVLGAAAAVTAALPGVQRAVASAHPTFPSTKGTVVIHHGDSTFHGVPFALATYDVLPKQGGLGMHRFDANGRQVVLPHEVAPGHTTPR